MLGIAVRIRQLWRVTARRAVVIEIPLHPQLVIAQVDSVGILGIHHTCVRDLLAADQHVQ